MTNLSIALVIAIVAASLSAFFIPSLTRVAHQLGLVQAPSSDRHVHTKPVPRIGGLGLFVAFVVGVGLSFWLPVERFPVEVERIALLLVGAVVIVAVMLYDDLVGIAPLPKLAWQVLAAGMVIVPRLRGPDHGLVIDQFNSPFGGVIQLPVLLAMVFTLFWIVGMMNTLNWLDGLDGLAGTVTLTASAVLFIHTFFYPAGNPEFTISLLPLALGAAVIGFLPYNWNPARIIMGDTGSMFLGYALAVISIIGGAKIATALLTLWLPILDVAWVILYRVLKGSSPLQADRGHLHHRLLDLGWSQQQVVLLFAGISAALGVASLLLPEPDLKLYALITVSIVGLIVLAGLARRSNRMAKRPVSEFSRRS